MFESDTSDRTENSSRRQHKYQQTTLNYPLTSNIRRQWYVQHSVSFQRCSQGQFELWGGLFHARKTQGRFKNAVRRCLHTTQPIECSRVILTVSSLTCEHGWNVYVYYSKYNTWYFTTALAAQTARFAGQLFVEKVTSTNHCSSSLVVLG